MTALGIFDYGAHEVRTVTIDGEPWFVLADLCRVLGLSNASTYAARLASIGEVTRMYPIPDAMGREQQSTIVNEPGMYEVVIRSDKPEAVTFRRWITTEVIPSIRRHGSYEITPRLPQSYAEALRELAASVERSEQLVAEVGELTPRAEAWDELASADGDYEVGDAAKILARAGVETGRQRLFNQLAALGWIYRQSGKWKARQTAVDAGYLAEKPQSHHHPRTGELVLDPPQARVTLRGVERLRVRLGVLTAVEVSA